jgi:DNA-binding IclR family transcriptional regulator
MEVLKELASEECQVSRALRALEGEGLVERDPLNRTYPLGSGLYTLAARGIETRLMRTASGHLDRLADEQHANVRLCVLIGAKVLTLISSPPHDAAGAEAPTQTPCGPVLTSDWPDAALRELVPACAPGHNNLLASCAEARARGYVYYPGNDAGPARYAAPVRDFRGIVLAAIQLAQGPGEEATGHGTAPEKAVVLAANTLSTELGFQG